MGVFEKTQSEKNKEKPVCARCGIDLRLPGVQSVKQKDKLYCDACAEQLDTHKKARAETMRFAAFMSGKCTLVPLDGAYMQWNRSVAVDKESGQLWLVHSRSVGGSGASFAATSVDVFAEEPQEISAREALRLAEEAHPGVGEAFSGMTDANAAEYIGRYVSWAQDQSRFEGCGPMAEQLKADFRAMGIPIAETLAHYGEPLYFGYEEKTGKYFVQEPAERSSGYTVLFRDTNRKKFRWFLLRYIVDFWAYKVEHENTEQLQADWRWAVPYNRSVPEKELVLQKLSRVYPADSEEILDYAARTLQALNRGQNRIVQWMLDPDTMTLYMPAEKHHHIQDLQAEQSRLEAQLQKNEKAPGSAVIRQRLDDLKLEGLFLDAGPDMAIQLTVDMKTLGFTAEQVKNALPDRFGHSAVGYWAEGVEEDRSKTFTYPVCRQASAEDFRFTMVERIVRLNVCWPQLPSHMQFSLWIRRLMKLFSHGEVQDGIYVSVLDPQLQAYVDEKIRRLEKSFPAYDWAVQRDWLAGTPKAGTGAPELPRPDWSTDVRESPSLFLYGDPSGHGEQFSAGPIRTGSFTGRYYWTISDDGYPNRMAGGGCTRLLPDGLVQNGCVLQRELYRWIGEIWPHTSALRVDEQDAVVLNLDQCRKEYPKPYRVSDDGILWQVDNGCAVILGYQGKAKDLVIPEKLDAYCVREIGAEAFCGHPLRSVEIPRWLERIGSHALGYEKSAPAPYTPKLTIRGYRWSSAQRYAKQHDLPFEDLSPVTNGKVRQGQKTEVGKTVTVEVYPSEEAKHWIGVEDGAAKPEKKTKSWEIKDSRPEFLSCTRCGKDFARGEEFVVVNDTAYCADCAARIQKSSEKFRMNIREILITLFFAGMAVVAFYAKGWLLGAVFGCIALFMPFGLYYDHKKEQERKQLRNTIYTKRKK